METWKLYALGSAFFAGLTAIFGKIGVVGINSNFATFIRTVIILVVIGLMVTLKSEWQKLSTLNLHSVSFLCLSAVATGFSWLCYYKALQMGPASRVAPIDKLSVAFAILLAVLFLGEKLSWQGMVGCALIVSGSVVLVLT
jgi:transporter family protein